MKYLDMTILFYDSIPSRIYLTMLKEYGYMPNKIIYLKFNRGKKYKFLKFFLGEEFINKIIEKKRIVNTDIDLVNNILKKFNITYEKLYERINLFTDEYSEIEIENINDKKLIDFLSKEKCKTFLYTGGGILKESIFSIPNSKFIHIHPGIVPEVKGADGLLWSYLIRNKAGYSCFYMNKGIDTGDIIYKKEYSLKKLKGINFSKYSMTEIYKYLLHFYDPCLRVQTLIQLLDNNIGKDLSKLEYDIQNPNDGRTYFFMHEKLRNIVLSKMLKEISG